MALLNGNIRINLLLRQIIDYIVLIAAFIGARKYIAIREHLFMDEFNLFLLLLSLFTWTIMGLSVKLYDDFRSRSFAYEFVAILKTVLLHTCMFSFLFFYCFKYYPYPRTFTCLYNILIFTGITTIRFIVKRMLLRLRASGLNSRNVLIIGAGETGMDFYRTITNNDHFGYRCVGFIDDQANPELNGQYLGRITELTGVLEKHEVDDVVLALPGTSMQQMEEVITISEKQTKRIRIIMDYHRFGTSSVTMTLFGTHPLVTIYSSPLDDMAMQGMKRVFDICFSICFLLLFSWLYLLIALLIKISSPGPVFFRQERWGLKNKRIMCYKFRSMRVQSRDTDQQGRYLQASRNDNRITPVGRFLRRTNLDELPQFINVLSGDMSVVGPRPHPIPLHLESRDTVQRYMLRHMVKPGITGWAQVNGCRGETRQPGQMQRRVNLDLWYIEHYSFWLDCQIIFQTLMNMIKGDKNAY